MSGVAEGHVKVLDPQTGPEGCRQKGGNMTACLPKLFI